METQQTPIFNGALDLNNHTNVAQHGRDHTHALIPRGVVDYFWDAAANRHELENRLLSVFQSWGYGYIIPPTLEYADTFETGPHSDQKKANMIRFLDHDGQSLALRYDMTMAIARLVGTRLHDAPMPQRFCYAGSIFRNPERQTAPLREFGQAGIELIGANTTEADTEVLALTARALQATGLSNFRITLGQLRFFRGLLEELQLPPSQAKALAQALQRRSEPELSHFLDEAKLSTHHQETVRTLFTLNGQDSPKTLAIAESIALNQTMRDAVANLSAIYHALGNYDLSKFIQIDLTEVSDLGYYTGIRFMAHAPGLGAGIASGGRYDNLISSFGPPQPAIGVALGLERILLALQSVNKAATPSLKHHVLVSSESSSQWVKIVEEWRAAGVSVVADVHGRYGEQLWSAAKQKGIPCALAWNGSGFDVFDNQAQGETPSQQIAAEESTAYLLSTLMVTP